MQAFIRGIRQPKLFFIWGKPNAVARAAVTQHRTLFKTFDLDTMQHPASFEVADFKTEQVVHVHVTKRLARVDCERPHHIAEWSDLANHLASLHIRNAQDR